jgi:hypothetical protein
MNYKNKCNRIFVDKGYTSNLYTWSPGCPDFTKKKLIGDNIRPIVYCSATAGSQGQDWVTTYVYDSSLINHKPARLAYVECDYVE